ncbi:MAG: hypothetical protein RLZZ623_2436 [Actinomycetota bacterium]
MAIEGVSDERRIDWQAIRSGASICLVLAVPFSLGARWAADSRDDSGLAILLTLGALAGFVVGSGVAAWVQQTGFPWVHALITASGTYLVAQAVFIMARLVMGRDVHWYAALFNITPVLFAGVLGGVLGTVLQRRGIVPSTRSARGQG